MPSIKIDGAQQVEQNLDRLAKKYGAATLAAANASALLVEADAKKAIQSASPGKVVVRYHAGSGTQYEHTAADEGSAPNTDTGTLVKSIRVETTANGIYIGSTLKYAGWLEFGTKGMGARPWLNPALEGNRATILRVFKLEVGKVK